MKELENIGPVVELMQWSHVGMPKCPVGLFDEISQFFSRDLIWGDVEREDLCRKIRKGVVLPFGLPVNGKWWYVFGDK